MQAQLALDHVRYTLCPRFGLTALDQPLRTKVQYFRTVAGRVFGLRVGDLLNGRFDHKTIELILEPVSLPAGLSTRCEVLDRPYRGSSTRQPTKGVDLKDAQTRVRVEGLVALDELLGWYAAAIRAA
ncbi:hypothetical protein ACG97_11910 [Vogesella sp. EB]|uniref:hypothetical protein n=1 Tax=Vogesella sp. EB TaxID=1526735 RepID=UPI00064D65FE|nr:hypothetical protein [Vogesella sp. EB]KMJ52767.1 hypothetical protein ACG97_11910 [Vogesella sp. EB]